MLVIAPSATPPQLDSVGECVTRMPNSVAASTSTSSTPIVYLATMRRLFELCMIFCVIGVLRIDVPTSASAPSDMCAISSSLSPCGVSQFALPCLRSQPAASSILSLSPVGSAGANTKTFALAMSSLLSSSDRRKHSEPYKPPSRQVNRRDTRLLYRRATDGYTLRMGPLCILCLAGALASIAGVRPSAAEMPASIQEAAKKEREVVVYGGIPGRAMRPISELFEKRYGVRINNWRGD